MVRSENLRLIPGILALSVLLACGGEAPPSEPTPTSTDDPAATTEEGGASEVSSADSSGNSSLQPISPRGQRTTGSSDAPPASTPGEGGGTQVVAAGAVFTVPPDWRSEPPSSSMRLAQATIPGPGGDGQLTVFHFGVGGGGGLESNLERWIGQVETAPGSTPWRDSFENAGLAVTWIDVLGTLKPSMMGTGPTTPQPDSELLGAVVEGPGGPWYFKATGPASTLTAARPAFVEMLRSIRLQS